MANMQLDVWKQSIDAAWMCCLLSESSMAMGKSGALECEVEARTVRAGMAIGRQSRRTKPHCLEVCEFT